MVNIHTVCVLGVFLSVLSCSLRSAHILITLQYCHFKNIVCFVCSSCRAEVSIRWEIMQEWRRRNECPIYYCSTVAKKKTLVQSRYLLPQRCELQCSILIAAPLIFTPLCFPWRQWTNQYMCLCALGKTCISCLLPVILWSSDVSCTSAGREEMRWRSTESPEAAFSSSCKARINSAVWGREVINRKGRWEEQTGEQVMGKA